jgi:hypothetical protein
LPGMVGVEPVPPVKPPPRGRNRRHCGQRRRYVCRLGRCRIRPVLCAAGRSARYVARKFGAAGLALCDMSGLCCSLVRCRMLRAQLVLRAVDRRYAYASSPCRLCTCPFDGKQIDFGPALGFAFSRFVTEQFDHASSPICRAYVMNWTPRPTSALKFIILSFLSSRRVERDVFEPASLPTVHPDRCSPRHATYG